VVDAPAARPTVAVVGGGVAGLAAAWELTGGATGPGPDAPAVVVLEADHRCGGKLATAEVAGVTVDVGPDGFLGRRPEAASLCRELGLGDALVPVGASGASVFSRGRRRPLPAGLVLGVPTRLVPVARSRVLSPAGLVRLALDLVAPRPDTRAPLGDRAVGPLVAHKLGRQTVARLVDPMLGGIHAGGVADASAAALFPGLLGAAQGRSSLMRKLRSGAGGRAPGGEAPADGAAGGGAAEGPGGPATSPEGDRDADDAPLFWAVRGGLGSLAAQLVAALESRGAVVRTRCAVTSLERPGGRWLLRTGHGEVQADAVVLALPAGPAAALLAPHDADAAATLRATDYASVAVVTLAYPADAVPDGLHGTGLLVPHGTRVPRTAAAAAEDAGADPREPCLVTACTYLWSKWPHLSRPEVRLLRASVGRFGDERFAALGDDRLVARVAAELGGLVGTTGRPVAAAVTRWPGALPQYRVHHLLRAGSVEAAVRRLGGLAVAGAAYHGVGVPACVASGRAAAEEVLAQLGALGRRAPV
jgi:oxygen-dependent protoporphyrinogen oxidase